MSEYDPDAAGTLRLPVVEQRAFSRPGPGGPADHPGGPAVLDPSLSAADDAPGPPAPYLAADGPAERRFWSARRVPAGIVAALGLAGAALLLYDLAAVRAGRPAMAWRRRLAEELGTRPLDDVWVTAGAAAVVVLGLWLLLLAATPGLRRVLPMRRPREEAGGEDVRAGLDRAAAAALLRHRAMEVPGVQSVRVAVRRRRVTVRARAHFRDLDEVRDDLDAVLGHGLRELGLARRPALALQLRRPGKG